MTPSIPIQVQSLSPLGALLFVPTTSIHFLSFSLDSQYTVLVFELYLSLFALFLIHILCVLQLAQSLPFLSQLFVFSLEMYQIIFCLLFSFNCLEKCSIFRATETCTQIMALPFSNYDLWVVTILCLILLAKLRCQHQLHQVLI